MLWDISEMPLRLLDDGRQLLLSWGVQKKDAYMCISFGGFRFLSIREGLVCLTGWV
jgi:hypothetical protein